MSKVKQVKVALLALVAALVIAIPTSAFAADTDLKLQGLSEQHTYEIYQVFTGTLDNGNLGAIQWGADVDITKLSEAFTGTSFANMTSAADVAAALNVTSGSPEDTAKAKEFAAAISKALKSYSSVEDLAKITMSKNGNIYSKTVADNGYYFIKDRDSSLTSQEGEAYTRYILVPGTTTGTIEIKADKPTVDKKVHEDSKTADQWGESADYTIGQTIPYKLVGTLPSNYADFKAYYYKFTDKMSKGLDLSGVTYDETDATKVVSGVTVTRVRTGAEDQDITSSFVIKRVVDEATGEETLSVEAENLKADNDRLALAYGDQIIVAYSAVLTSDAQIGTPGNPNEVYLTYSTDPNKDNGGDKGNTPTEYCIVFTYELDNLKTGEGADSEGLANAKFVLINNTDGDADKDKIARVEDGKFVAWVQDTPEDRTTYALTSSAAEGTKGQFNIKGLDEGKYKLVETVSPENYALLANPIEFEIISTVSYDDSYAGGTATSPLTKLQIKVGGTTSRDAEDGSNQGTVKQEISNTLSANLPSTGGIGTTIFTVVGLGLIIAAIASVVVRRRRSATTA